MISTTLRYLAFAGLAALVFAPSAHAQGMTSSMSAMNATAADAGVVVGTLTITGAFTRATLPNAPVGGGFFTITNNGANGDVLISATSPAAGDVQIHEMKMEGEVMKMRELPDGLEIPANSTMSLTPGGLHLMFMKLNGPFVEGQSVPVTLTFKNAGEVTLNLPVGTAAAHAM